MFAHLYMGTTTGQWLLIRFNLKKYLIFAILNNIHAVHRVLSWYDRLPETLTRGVPKGRFRVRTPTIEISTFKFKLYLIELKWKLNMEANNINIIHMNWNYDYLLSYDHIYDIQHRYIIIVQ